MLVEILITSTVCFFIAVCFYTLRRETTEILQVEFSAAPESLRELSQEKQPIVIRGAPVPQNVTNEKLSQIPRLDSFPLGDGETSLTLKDYRLTPAAIPDSETGRPILSNNKALMLAKELALDTWVSHTIQDTLYEMTGIFSFATMFQTRVILGGVGLTRPISNFVCILPIDGTYTVSLVSRRSETFLPRHWKHRYAKDLTINDTPLVSEIKFIDIILRPGTLLVIPVHCIYSLQPSSSEFHSALQIDMDTPVSLLSKKIDSLAY
jgi:hypothetical protein